MFSKVEPSTKRLPPAICVLLEKAQDVHALVRHRDGRSVRRLAIERAEDHPCALVHGPLGLVAAVWVLPAVS